jgi:hypothetical protein
MRRDIAHYVACCDQYLILVDFLGWLLVWFETRFDWQPMLNDRTIQSRHLRIIPGEAIFVFL